MTFDMLMDVALAACAAAVASLACVQLRFARQRVAARARWARFMTR